eukprot:TRINITY_DN1014_c1_g1_i4.p1 TRINITY_DN1014_c1_g1~~TRINITY_DN1014_c1_g1_i4.p1  ORF type:complete len:243 (+),score=0.51 TRINITY_DN1014_c1_g1_i4:176-904(+)
MKKFSRSLGPRWQVLASPNSNPSRRVAVLWNVSHARLISSTVSKEATWISATLFIYSIVKEVMVTWDFNISSPNHACASSLSLIQETFGVSETSYDNIYFTFCHRTTGRCFFLNRFFLTANLLSSVSLVASLSAYSLSDHIPLMVVPFISNLIIYMSIKCLMYEWLSFKEAPHQNLICKFAPSAPPLLTYPLSKNNLVNALVHKQVCNHFKWICNYECPSKYISWMVFLPSCSFHIKPYLST